MTVVESDPHCWGSGWNFEPCVCHVGNSCGCQSGWEWVLSPSRRKAEGRPFPCFSRHLCSPWGFLAWNIYGRFEVKVRTLRWFLWRCRCYPHCSLGWWTAPTFHWCFRVVLVLSPVSGWEVLSFITGWPFYPMSWCSSKLPLKVPNFTRL